MHYTAMMLGQKFFETYLNGATDLKIVDIGSQDVNGSLRSAAPPGNEYCGIDFVDGKGVDLIITDPYALPLEDNSVDAVVCSSCFEHSEFFWLLFNDIQRILKPHGILYLNVPSNGTFHKYPVDCWRFYPDSGVALQNWAQRSGYSTTMLESFTHAQEHGVFNDFVAVFVKDSEFVDKYPSRMQATLENFSNGLEHGHKGYKHYSAKPEDQRLGKMWRKLGTTYLRRLTPKFLR